MSSIDPQSLKNWRYRFNNTLDGQSKAKIRLLSRHLKGYIDYFLLIDSIPKNMKNVDIINLLKFQLTIIYRSREIYVSPFLSDERTDRRTDRQTDGHFEL